MNCQFVLRGTTYALAANSALIKGDNM